MLLISTVLRWPLWGLLFLSRAFIRWRSLFVVYPGQPSDIRAYSPDSLIWLRNTWLFRGKPQFAGIQIRHGVNSGGSYWGVVVYLSSTAQELTQDKQLLLDILRRLKFIGRLLGTRVIACAGQIPSILHKHNIPIEAPFIDGRFGAAYSVISTVNRIYLQHDMQRHRNLLAIVGIGFLGKTVMENLQSSGYRVLGIDIVPTQDGIRIGEDAIDTLTKSDAVLVLTPRGKDFVPYLQQLKPGAIVIDDTHPKLKRRIDDHPVYKVALEWPGFAFYPRLPGYKKQWIPGCMVEAIVKSISNQPLTDYKDFSLRAEQAGIAVLIEPVKHS